MRIFVVRMRRRGAKLPIDAVKAVAPTVGWLHITTMTWRPHWLPDRLPEPTTFASLTETFDVASKRLLPQLQHAAVVRLRGHQFVIAGAEILSHRGHPAEFRQAWWCRADSPRHSDGAPPGNRERLHERGRVGPVC